MTRYEELDKKIRDVTAAAQRCLRNGCTDMVDIWLEKRRALIEKLTGLSVGEALAVVK